MNFKWPRMYYQCGMYFQICASLHSEYFIVHIISLGILHQQIPYIKLNYCKLIPAPLTLHKTKTLCGTYISIYHINDRNCCSLETARDNPSAHPENPRRIIPRNIVARVIKKFSTFYAIPISLPCSLETATKQFSSSFNPIHTRINNSCKVRYNIIVSNKPTFRSRFFSPTNALFY